MRWWQLFRQAMTGVARARLRSALTSAGIAIGCGALVSMVAFALGLQQQMEAPFKKLGLLNDIRVSAKGRDERGANDAGKSAKPAQTPPTLLDDKALAAFRAIPGVKYAYPEMRLSNVSIKASDKEAADAIAVAAPREAALSDQIGELISSGSFFSLDDAPEIVLSEGITKSLGFKTPAEAVGKTVSASAAGLAATKAAGQFEFERTSVDLRVVGVFQPPGFGPFTPGGGNGVVLLPVDVMQQLPGLVESQLGGFRRQGTTALGKYRQVVVRSQTPLEVETIATAIRDQGFDAQTMISQLEGARMAFLFLKSLLSAVGSVALVIAGLGIANTLLMTVLERYEEIGLYKAIGATDGDVRLLFLSEAAVLGFIGGLAGLALAGVVCWGMQWGITLFFARQGITQAVDAFYFPWWLLTGAVGFSMLVSILSGIYPASRAARVDPIAALRRA